jgi:hypothetical protein
VYASIQAYGLRDDCAGAECRVVKEKKPRRSPTWNELLYLYASAWSAGLDGAVLYSHYFALYDSALSKRVTNLEKLMDDVFLNLPVHGPGIDVRGGAKNDEHPQSRGKRARSEGVYAGYVPDPRVANAYDLVVLYNSKSAGSVDVEIDSKLRVSSASERRFDAQGNELEPSSQDLRKKNRSVSMQVSMDGPGVRIFQLRHD